MRGERAGDPAAGQDTVILASTRTLLRLIFLAGCAVTAAMLTTLLTTKKQTVRLEMNEHLAVYATAIDTGGYCQIVLRPQVVRVKK